MKNWEEKIYLREEMFRVLGVPLMGAVCGLRWRVETPNKKPESRIHIAILCPFFLKEPVNELVC